MEQRARRFLAFVFGRQLVAFLMLLASAAVVVASTIIGNIPQWTGTIASIVIFGIGCLIVSRREETEATFGFLRELKRITNNFDQMTKQDRSNSLSRMWGDINTILDHPNVPGQNLRQEKYDKEARVLQDCVSQTLSGRKEFFSIVLNHFLANSRNLSVEMLEKLVDELRDMVIQHQRFADRFVDLVDRMGYVTKSMKEQFNGLKIEHNGLSGALRSLIQEVNDDLATKLSDFVPPVAKEFTAKVVD